MESQKLRLLLVLGVFGVTSSSFIIVQADKEPYSIAFVRVFLTGMISYFLLFPRTKSENPVEIPIKDRYKIFFSGFCLATHFGWWFASLDYIQIGISLALTNTAPVWVTLILFLLYHRVPKFKQVLAILLVIFGSLLLLSQNHDINSGGTIGIILALGSAIGLAIYLLTAHSLLDKYGLWRYFGLVNLSAAFCLFMFNITRGHIGDLFDTQIWFWGLLLALLPGISGHAVFNFLMSKLDPIDVSVATLGEPILGAIFAYLIYDQKLSLLETASMLCLISAIGFTLDRSAPPESILKSTDVEPFL